MAEAASDFDDLANQFGLNSRITAVRKFRKLFTIVLFGMQQELCELERKLQIKPGYAVDIPATSNVSVPIQQVISPSCQAEPVSGGSPTLEDVCRKLEQYQRLLLRFIEVNRLRKLDRIDFEDLKETIDKYQRDYPSAAQKLEPWRNTEELVGLFTQHDPKRDRFTRWMMTGVYWLVNKKKGPIRQSIINTLRLILPDSWIRRIRKFLLLSSDESASSQNGEAISINEKGIANFIAVANVFIASSLNVSSMFALYAVESTWRRIGMIVAFTFLFTASTLIFTTAEPAIVYASTAAYSAVLVVFVGNVN